MNPYQEPQAEYRAKPRGNPSLLNLLLLVIAAGIYIAVEDFLLWTRVPTWVPVHLLVPAANILMPSLGAIFLAALVRSRWLFTAFVYSMGVPIFDVMFYRPYQFPYEPHFLEQQLAYSIIAIVLVGLGRVLIRRRSGHSVHA